MVFEYDLVIPAATPALSPVSLEMPLARGIIHKVEAQFLYGCRGLVFVVVRRALHQVFPANPDGQLKAEGYVISFPTYYPLEEAPFKLEAYGWSPDTTYQHTVTLRFGIEPREVLEPARPELGFLRRLEQLIFRGR